MIYEINKEADGKTKIIYRPYCLPYSEDDCWSLHGKLKTTSGENVAEVNTPDKLRAFPVFFNPPENLTLFEYLEEIIEEPKVWKKVKGGDDLKAREQMRKLARPIIEKHYHLILAAERVYDYVAVGATMEAELAAAGIVLQARGGCGVSNQEALKNLQDSNTGVFDALFNSAQLAEATWTYHTGNCAACGTTNVEVGPCSICKSCEKIL